MLRDVSASEPEGPHPDDRDLLALRRGALEAPRARQVERHLASCRDCRDLFAEMAEPVPATERARAIETVRRASGRGRRVRAASWAGGLIAAAAAALLVVSLREREAPLPEYAMQGPYGGQQRIRAGDLPASATFEADGRLELVLVPATPVSGEAPRLWVYVGSPGATPRRADVSAARSEDGAFRLEARVREVLGSTPGEYALHAIVNRADSAPETFADVAALEAYASDQPHFTTTLRLVAPKDEEP